MYRVGRRKMMVVGIRDKTKQAVKVGVGQGQLDSLRASE